MNLYENEGYQFTNFLEPLEKRKEISFEQYFVYIKNKKNKPRQTSYINKHKRVDSAGPLWLVGLGWASSPKSTQALCEHAHFTV